MEIIDALNSKDFINNLNKKGEVFLVGGIVRDSLLNKDSKDIDLLVTGIPMNELIDILTPHGKVDTVGESFGIIKFSPSDMKLSEPIDIALPRTERKINEGHKGFDIISDHQLPIEEDLFRRDFTINSMAMSMNSNIVDPYNGIKDIKNKKIKLVNPDAFIEDPLRMLRAVQFASRFFFNIEKNTLETIIENSHLIKEITGERILIELDKIFHKGNHKIGVKLLKKCGLFKNIFDNEPEYKLKSFNENHTNRFDFFFKLFDGLENRGDIFKEVLKGDVETIRILKGLEKAHNEVSFCGLSNKVLCVELNRTSTQILESNILPIELTNTIAHIKENNLPISISDLNINGNDLIEHGFSGEDIGKKLKEMLLLVMMGENNDKENLLNLLG